MPFYRVMLNGTGIKMPSQGAGEEIIGFYTTRLVWATTEEDAVQKACDKIKKQWATGSYASSNRGTLPELSLEWVRRTSFLDLFFFKASGHMFYGADDKAA